jgi:RadC-like JAB domain-containing protein
VRRGGVLGESRYARVLTAAVRPAAAASGNPPERPQGTAVMSDVTLPSVPSVAVRTVRRARGRRSAPREAGTDLLQVSSRLTEEEAHVLAQARAILFKLAACPRGRALNSPSLVREYLTTLLSGQDREYFTVVALDNRHRVLASEILFAGTIDGARVYPREVVRCALRHNAAAVIFFHFVAGHVMGVMHP